MEVRERNIRRSSDLLKCVCCADRVIVRPHLIARMAQVLIHGLGTRYTVTGKRNLNHDESQLSYLMWSGSRKPSNDRSTQLLFFWKTYCFWIWPFRAERAISMISEHWVNQSGNGAQIYSTELGPLRPSLQIGFHYLWSDVLLLQVAPEGELIQMDSCSSGDSGSSLAGSDWFSPLVQ